MKLTILGSGTFVPNLRRHSSSYLLEIGLDKIVFDIGRGSLESLLGASIDCYDLNNIFISHIHSDHITDLLPFLQFILEAPQEEKLKEKYVVYGPKEIGNSVEKLLEASDIHDNRHLNRISIKQLSPEKVLHVNNLDILAFEVEHNLRLQCFAYRISGKGKVIAYSGDSPDCVGLRKACKNADLAIMEANWPYRGLFGHSNGEDAGRVAQECGIKKLVLTHVTDEYLPMVKEDAQREFGGEIIVAKDLMKIEI